MANLFRSVRVKKPKRNVFDLSHETLLTTEFGRLTPFYIEEVVPGDTFQMKTELLMRCAPLYAPVMHRVNIYTHFFFVPCRLLWKQWETFITGGPNGDGTIKKDFSSVTSTPQKPYLSGDTFENIDPSGYFRRVRTLWDYLGFPTQTGRKDSSSFVPLPANKQIDLMPFKAYHLICNEYYRDENLQEAQPIFEDFDGDLYASRSSVDEPMKYLEAINGLFSLRYRNWEKDYFTSALPFPQRGEEVTIGEDGGMIRGSGTYEAAVHSTAGGEQYAAVEADQLADMLTASVDTVSINELRRALAIQKFREALARFGSRYTEFLRGIFGTNPRDSRLQRPEFLGGGKTPFAFGEVLQTSQTDTDPLGTYGGRGIAASAMHSFKRSFDEHGYIIGILSVMPKPSYMNGFPRMYNRFDKLDYYIPQFAHLGEQEILSEELNFTNSEAYNNSVFGYTPRYAEYKFRSSNVHGDFRSSLLPWHMARQFTNLAASGPRLNDSFLRVSTAETGRIFNVTDSSFADHLWLQMYHDIKAIRPMPKFGTPMI